MTAGFFPEESGKRSFFCSFVYSLDIIEHCSNLELGDRGHKASILGFGLPAKAKRSHGQPESRDD